MELQQALHEIGKTLPAELVPQKDGSLKLEAVVAERKSFLSKKKLTYTCRMRVDGPGKQLRFFEMLKESGFGLSGGGTDEDGAPGFGFKKEVYKTAGAERNGSIEEQSRLFGKDYCFRFDFGRFRESVRQASEAAGFAFEVKWTEKAV
jgi:hypothetical protein